MKELRKNETNGADEEGCLRTDETNGDGEKGCMLANDEQSNARMHVRSYDRFFCKSEPLPSQFTVENRTPV